MAIFGRGLTHARISILVVIGTLLAVCALPGAARAASPADTLGVYRGSAAPDQVAAFDAWRGGGSSRFALDFLAMDSWDTIAHPDWWATGWKDRPYRVAYSIPLIPRSGGTLATGATGAYNTYFESLARTLVAHGQADAILRLGWEFNGDWYPWAASRDPAAFVAYWRQVVTAIRAVPGARFTIDWNPTLGRGGVEPDRVYPGDAYVDVIGLDVYDQGWYANWTDPAARWKALVEQPYGLAWHRDFAAAHGKPVSFAEWGLMIRADGHGGGDNAYYIQRMYDWIAASNVLYHCYFEFDAPDGSHRLMGSQFPVGAAQFKALFGPAAATPPSPSPSPAPVQPAPVAPPVAKPSPAPTAITIAPVARPNPRPAARPTVRVTRVRSTARRVRVAGRVLAASGGRVRVELRVRAGGGWRPVRARSARIRADGRFTTAVRRPAGRLRVVASYVAS
jgi:hypothetical protein